MNLISKIKALFSKTGDSPIFYFVVVLFVLNSIYMAYYIIQIFSIYPKVLDLETFGYSAQKVTAIFDAYGEEGLSLYKKVQIGDLFYPLSVFFFSGSLLYRTYKEEGSWVYFLPLIATLSDYCENYFLWSFRTSYPIVNGSLVNISSIFSVVKHSSLVLIISLVLKKLISK